MNKRPDYSAYAAWRTEGITGGDGVIVGSSQKYEKLLPWWWINYRLHNAYPVAFFDLGMSPSAKKWCEKRGEFYSLKNIPADFIAKREEVDPQVVQKWEENYSSAIWEAREGWFLKPFAMLNSPFDRTVWIDLDCQVRKSIAPLFKTCELASGLAMAVEPKGLFKKDPCFEKAYNSGVVAFKRGSSLVRRWVDGLFELTDQFMGDQQVLSHLIFDEKIQVGEISILYNWFHRLGTVPEASIIHWLAGGKQIIDLHLTILESLSIDVKI